MVVLSLSMLSSLVLACGVDGGGGDIKSSKSNDTEDTNGGGKGPLLLRLATLSLVVVDAVLFMALMMASIRAGVDPGTK